MDGTTDASTLLPPLPDWLVIAKSKEAAISWLGGQPIPPNYRARWLREWGSYTGVPVGKADYDRVQGFP